MDKKTTAKRPRESKEGRPRLLTHDGSMGRFVYLPTFTNKNQPFMGRFVYLPT